MTSATKSMEEIIRQLRLERDKLAAELAATKHRKSGLYHFRDTEVRDMSRGIQRLEHGDWDGLRLLTGVMDELHGSWRDFA